MSVLKIKNSLGEFEPVLTIDPSHEVADWMHGNAADTIDGWLDDNIMQETGYVLDRSLTSTNAAAPADMVGGIKITQGNEIHDVNSSTIIVPGWNQGNLKVDGVSTNSNVIYSDPIPVGPSDVIYYRCHQKNDETFRLFFFPDENIADGASTTISGDGYYSLSDDSSKTVLRIRIGSNSTAIKPETGDIRISLAKVTSDTILQPTGDTTDRTVEIEKALKRHKICRLGAGEYYVNGVDMPEGSMLVGYGAATKIILGAADEAFAIKLGTRTSVKNLMIIGSDDPITLDSTVGTRHGITWSGNYDVTYDKDAQPKYGTVDNCIICGFSGGGLTCRNTGPAVEHGLNVTNVQIYNCNAGINIAYYSEFHRMTNVIAYGCYYGCVNNGGNNVFANCGFSNNKVGMILKMVNGSGKPTTNNAHGSAIGCIFNHMDRDDTTLGKGEAIHFEGAATGFVFEGCQFFYSSIYLQDSVAVSFRGCNFGYMRNLSGDGVGTKIALKSTDTGKYKTYFSDCVFALKPVIEKTALATGSFNVVWDKCYTRSGRIIPDQASQPENIDLSDIVLYTEFEPGGIYTDTDPIVPGTLDDAHLNNDPAQDYRYYHIAIPCEEGDEYDVEALGMGSGGTDREEAHLQYVFTDGSYNLLSSSRIYDITSVDIRKDPFVTAKAPAGAAWLFVNHRNIANQIWYTPKVYKLSDNPLTNFFARNSLGRLPYVPDAAWKREVIAAYKNMIAIKDGNYIKLSRDCGKTWNAGVDVSDVISGSTNIITNAHIYSNGCLAFFGRKNAYYIDGDWDEYHEAICYGADGTEIDPSELDCDMVFKSYNDYAERKFVTINNTVRDMYVFGNYKYGRDERAFIWYSVDMGHSYKIAFDFGVTEDADSSVIVNGYPLNIRHIHGILYFAPKDRFLCMTGDYITVDETTGLSESCVLELEYNGTNDSWSATLLGTGIDFKWTTVAVWNGELYYANDNTPGRVMKCKYDDIGTLSRHVVVLDGMYNDPRHIIFGHNGDMIVTQCDNRNIHATDFSAPKETKMEARGFYYSPNRRDFSEINLPLLQLRGSNEIAFIKPLTDDGHVFINTYKRSPSGNNRDHGILPSICLDEFIRTMGYPNAFGPAL